MSLITLPAFLLRRRGDTPVPETTTAPKSDGVMWFRTRGGAFVELRKSYRTTWVKSDPAEQKVVYPFRCLGCDYEFDNYSHLATARSEANEHAGACWSTTKPEG